MSVLQQSDQCEAFAALSHFRDDFYDFLHGRGDALFELCDALLCTDGPVRTLVGLALAPEHRRGHGALYGALNHGQIEVDRLRHTLAGRPLPRAADGRLVLAVDVSPWLRPDAATSDARSFCHTYGRGENRTERDRRRSPTSERHADSIRLALMEVAPAGLKKVRLMAVTELSGSQMVRGLTAFRELAGEKDWPPLVWSAADRGADRGA